MKKYSLRQRIEEDLKYFKIAFHAACISVSAQAENK